LFYFSDLNFRKHIANANWAERSKRKQCMQIFVNAPNIYEVKYINAEKFVINDLDD
jgi:hypothetical protein